MRSYLKYSVLIVLGLFALAKLAFGANLPDISGLSRDTQLSIKMACALEKTEGPAKYTDCILQQFIKLSQSPGIPDISSLSQDTQLSIKMACALEKTQGPVNYGSCIALHLRSIGVDPSY